MIKRLFLFALLIGLMACRPNTKAVDYFGENTPETTPVIFGEGIISTKGRLEHGISFTPNMETLAFGVLDSVNFNGAIYHSRKKDNSWSAPEIFDLLKAKSVYLPYFSPDGKSMLYAQSRPDTDNGYTDIWMLKKNEGFWGQPEKINSPVNSLSRESSACMTLDGTIYFSSNRGDNGLADIYVASNHNGKAINVKRIDSASSAGDEESIFISPDERYMIFCRYTINTPGPDLFISYRNVRGDWIQATPLDTTINSSQWERRPFVSEDNKYLFFTKLTFNAAGLEESDIYWVSTQKVFKPFVFNPITKKTIKVGITTEISIPKDYFKDIDNADLDISLGQDHSEWIEFDKANGVLRMTPTTIGNFDLVFTAMDRISNQAEHVVNIVVEP